VLIVGAGALARQTAQQLESARPRSEVIGLFSYHDERPALEPVHDYLGPVSRLQGWLLTQPVAEVYIAGDPAKHAQEMQEAIDDCELLGVPFALPAHRFRMARARPAEAHPSPDGFQHYLPIKPRPARMALKRLFDVCASGAALVVLAPPLLLVAALIKLTSRGPVLFRQVRVGLGGRPFFMLKFRSMVVDAEKLKASLASRNEQQGPVFKIRQDPRITPLGRILRKFSIDELPQLVNVLRGEMSIVGPRPPVPSEVSRYEPWQRRRLSVRPGLTCIWQVSGRNQITFEEWMYLDMRYIDHWSLGSDLALVFKTVPVVVTGRGAS
jgi:exopolysaccharide biosynthesis polyprenyl glycosylphosphotransferase